MNALVLVLGLTIGFNPAQEVLNEQAAIAVASTIEWDCTTDLECMTECVAQGMPATLCYEWSRCSSGCGLEDEVDDDEPQTSEGSAEFWAQ